MDYLKKLSLPKNFLILLAAAFFVRLALSPFGTLELDFNTFRAWSANLAQNGFAHFYTGWSDYLPGYLYVLWVLGKIVKLFPLIPAILLYKLPSILADLVGGIVIYKIVDSIKSKKAALISSSIYLFNPAIIANSTLWGQVDSVGATLSMLALYFAAGSPIFSAIFLAAGVLVKPQAAVVAPVIGLLLLSKKTKLTAIAKYALVALAVFIAAFVPFNTEGGLVSFIVERLNATTGQYPYTSINAFNFWGLGGFWKPDDLQYLLGAVAAVALSFGFYIRLKKQKGWEYILAAFAYLANFLFFTRMHERHLFPAFAPLTVSVALVGAAVLPLLWFSLSYLANLRYSFIWITQDFREIFSLGFAKLFILGNLASLVGFATILLQRVKFSVPKKLSKSLSAKARVPKLSDFAQAHTKWFLAGLVLFALVTRIMALNSPQNEYFDEVYHAFTARSMLHGNTFAWEWWNTPPEGFAYEWTHPPLAKLFMVVGMSVVGENSVGWRLPAALLGTVSVLMVYLLAREFFTNRSIALLSAVVFALDGLPLVESRIGMNDIYFLCFSLIALYLFIKDKHLFASIALGLAAASKWSTLWVLPIFALGHFVFRKRFQKGYLWYLVLPATIYLASYFPLFTNPKIQNEYIQNTGYNQSISEKTGIVGLDMFIDTQKQIWWYHTRLKATHPFTSSWWSWPILARPVWLYTNSTNGYVENIYAMGNPLVFWIGLLSIFISLIYAWGERNRKLALVVFSYLIFFVPWAASPRIMFLYHYLPSIPFLAMATGFVLKRSFKNPWWVILILFVTFIYFYPHWIGIPVSRALDNSYYWFDSWK